MHNMFLRLKKLPLFFLLGFFSFSASSAVPLDQPESAQIEFSSAATTMLLSFGEVNPEFKDQDRTPLLRVYGDGRVLVYHPTYSKQAGEYEMYLSRDALSSLLLEVATPVFDYDQKAVKQQKKDVSLKRATQATKLSEVTVFYQSDAPVSVFAFNIETFKPAGSAKQLVDVSTTQIHWRGLAMDAVNFPEISIIQDFRRIENRLRSLSQSKQLRKNGNSQ